MKPSNSRQGNDSVGDRYSVGQVWRYKHRPGEDSSLLYIAAIDSHPKMGNIYSIYLCKLKVKNPYISGGVQHALPHAPVAREVLDMSVTERADVEIDTDGFGDGYKEWKSEFDAGRAGVFTISVAEIVDLVEESVNRRDDRK